jgi:ADP-dependent NAD(P)H-hydrate dehydratase
LSRVRALNRSALRAHPIPKIVDGDKETKGRILVVAGSRNVPGAALLAATAAMRAGAGKLHIVAVDSIAVPLGVAMPEAMVSGLAEGPDGGFASSAVSAIAKHANQADAIVAGPGMVEDATCQEIAKALIQSRAQLALDAALLKNLPVPKRPRTPVPILLPHSGELAALLDNGEDEIMRDPIGCGLRAAKRYRSIVLVKGITSHVVTPLGDVWAYSGGAPGLGVSGSGDVLAGIVGGLLARGAESLNALLWSVWLHGEAGANLAKTVGSIGFLAREVAGEISSLLPNRKRR